MTTQDPELSAALGWPGGISDPVLDRAQLLQMVAALRLASKQALEALDAIREADMAGATPKMVMKARSMYEPTITALRAALAQEQAKPWTPAALGPSLKLWFDPSNPWASVQEHAEPVQEHEDWCASVTQLLLCDPPKKAPCNCRKRKTEPLNLRDPAVQKRLAAQWGYAPAEQAEPVPGAWVASPDGRVIYDDTSADDGLLRVSGDFANDEQRLRYAQRIVDALNAALSKAEPAQEQGDTEQEPVDVGLLEYRGNSVAFIHQKMTAYRTGIDAAWDAFRANGLHPDGKTSLADMIAKYAAPPKAEPVQEPVAKVELMTTGGNAGLATRIVEIDNHLRERLRPGQLLYTAPPRRTMVPLTEEEIDAEWHELDGEASPLFKRVIRKFARAIEKASWEKNHGQA